MSRGMIPADLFRMQWVPDARIPPGGRTLAFTITRLEEADDYRSAMLARTQPVTQVAVH